MPEPEKQSDVLDLLPLVASTIKNRLALLERIEAIEAQTLHINKVVAREKRELLELLNLALRVVQVDQQFAGIPIPR